VILNIIHSLTTGRRDFFAGIAAVTHVVATKRQHMEKL